MPMFLMRTYGACRERSRSSVCTLEYCGTRDADGRAHHAALVRPPLTATEATKANERDAGILHTFEIERMSRCRIFLLLLG